MEHFIDDFSKRLGKAVSRRDVLSISARTIFAAFISSTGVGKLWGSDTTTLGSSQVCPSCGTCQQCNTVAGKCGQDCDNPCTAAVLCNLAQQFPPFVTLQSFLASQFTGNVSEPQAIVLQVPSVGHPSVLWQMYTGTDPNQTAMLLFSNSGNGLNAFAIQYNNGVPQFGYLVSTSGTIQQVLPPSLAASILTSEISSTTSDELRATSLFTATTTSTITPEQCTKFLAVGMCGVVLGLIATGVGYGVCILLGLSTGIGGLICTLEVTALLGAGPIICADGAVNLCKCIGVNCGSCGKCISGNCEPLCSSGQTCCGTTCCDSGQTCCVGTTCCGSGQTCSNGQCVSTNCGGIRPVPCGPTGCCGAGFTCCNLVNGNYGCAAPGYDCCANGLGACLPGFTCCTLPNGSITCC
jgi:hypothetical protein